MKEIEEPVLPVLPSDLVLSMILPRLPAKSLMRFKCVCKSWSSLIRHDPFFLRCHQNLHKNHDLLLINCQTEIISPAPTIQSASHNLQLKSFTVDKNIRFNINNGLICLYDNDIKVRPVHIYNPSTREFDTLPWFPQNILLTLTHSYYYSNYIGFSPVTNEYKVVNIISGFFQTSGIQDKTMFNIFTLGRGNTNSWRRVPDNDFDDLAPDPKNHLLYSDRHLIDPDYCECLCNNGALHWVQRQRSDSILAFDIAEERFRVIPFPRALDKGCLVRSVIEVNGCLALCTTFENDDWTMGLWILKDYQNQVWDKETVVFPDRFDKLGTPIPVCTIPTGEILLRTTSSNVLHLYDRQLESYKKSPITLPLSSIICSYTENIVPLRTMRRN